MEEQLCLRFNVCGPGKEWQIRVKRGKKIAVGILSAAVVVLLFAVLQRLVQPKYADDISEGNFTAEYYQETTKHDVLMIGDCEFRSDLFVEKLRDYQLYSRQCTAAHMAVLLYVRGYSEI